MKSVILSDETHRQIVSLKMQEKAKTADELLSKLIIEYRKQKLHEFSKKFRKALKEKGITFDEFLKESRKIREEIADEWYPD